MFQLARLTQMLRSCARRRSGFSTRPCGLHCAAFLARVPQRIGMGIRAQRLHHHQPGSRSELRRDLPDRVPDRVARTGRRATRDDRTEPDPAVGAVAAMDLRFAVHVRPWTVIGLGASTPNKDWSRAQWITFIEAVRRRTRGTIFLIGGPANAPVATGLIESTAGASMINACDLSLIESAALMKSANLFVGPNSGPMNIAAALGTPAFGFFATNKVLTYSRHIHAILPDDGRLAAGRHDTTFAAARDRADRPLSRRLGRHLRLGERHRVGAEVVRPKCPPLGGIAAPLGCVRR